MYIQVPIFKSQIIINQLGMKAYSFLRYQASKIAVRCGDPVERGKVSERGGGREWEQNIEREMRCVSA